MTTAALDLSLRKPLPLPRGGLVVLTSCGPVQFGVPPETIKDSMVRPHGVPNLYVLTKDFFSYERGVSFAEMEFPIYFNFFVAKRRARVVGTEAQRERLFRFMQESMFGPPTLDLAPEIGGGPEQFPWFPDLAKEGAFFRRHPFDPKRAMQLEDVLEFFRFEDGDNGTVEIDGLRITRNPDDSFLLIDPARIEEPCAVPGGLKLPPHTVEPESRTELFQPPVFGATILGSGHGFDPNTKTTGFILWVNGRGIMVDPPVDTTEWLREREVPPRCVDSLILTHCHGDHDTGTLQKALQADRIRLYTTRTIYESFLRKSHAITGLPKEMFGSILQFRELPIRRPVRINAATFEFHYTLHSIPTIGFQCWLGGKSLMYTSDTLNDPDRIRGMRDQGVMSEARAQHLLDFPWHHDLIIHEAGVPPLHTPAAILAKQPAEVKAKTYLVHTTATHIPADSGLRLAPTGLSETLVLEAERSEQSEELHWLTAMRAVEHFRDMPLAKATEFLEIVHTLWFEPGEHVIRKGEPGRYFYMILNGKAAILAGEVSRKVFGMYDYFGEASLVMDVPRTVDVVAVTRLRVLVIEKDDFLSFIRGTGIDERMRRLFANRGLNTWALMDKHPILRSMSTAQRNELQTFMEVHSYRRGELLLAEGTQDVPAFLIATGAVEELRRGEVVRRYEEGELAAAIERVTGPEPSHYALRAAVDGTQAFVFAPEPFNAFLRGYPGLYLRLLHGT